MCPSWHGSATSAAQPFTNTLGYWKDREEKNMDIPKIFWAFYDLFRRKQITLAQFSEKAGLPEDEINRILKEISKSA